MNKPDFWVLLPLMAAVVIVTALTAPAGMRLAGKVFLFGLLAVGAEFALITVAPTSGAWLLKVIR